jgi:hypothetical protein
VLDDHAARIDAAADDRARVWGLHDASPELVDIGAWSSIIHAHRRVMLAECTDRHLDVLEAGHSLIDQFGCVLGVTAAAARAAGRTDELRAATDLARADARRICNGPIRRCLEPEDGQIDTSCYRLELESMLEAWLTAAYTSLVVADVDLIEPGILDLGIGWLAALVDPERATATYRTDVAPPLPALAGQVQQALRPGSRLRLDSCEVEQARWRGCARAASRGVGAPITVELGAALAWLVASGDLTPDSVRVA